MGLESNTAQQIRSGRSFADIRSSSLSRAATMRQQSLSRAASFRRAPTFAGGGSGQGSRSAAAAAAVASAAGGSGQGDRFDGARGLGMRSANSSFKAAAGGKDADELLKPGGSLPLHLGGGLGTGKPEGSLPLHLGGSLGTGKSSGSFGAKLGMNKLGNLMDRAVEEDKTYPFEDDFLMEEEVELHNAMQQESRQVPLFHMALIAVLMAGTLSTSLVSYYAGCGTGVSWLIKVGGGLLV
jgi:hypothetical protein